jgi:nucleoside-diphosphate-sugar epimerase
VPAALATLRTGRPGHSDPAIARKRIRPGAGLRAFARCLENRAAKEIVGVARCRPSAELDKVRWVSADVASDDLSVAFAGVDAVIHLAWLIQPSRDPGDR